MSVCHPSVCTVHPAVCHPSVCTVRPAVNNHLQLLFCILLHHTLIQKWFTKKLDWRHEPLTAYLFDGAVTCIVAWLTVPVLKSLSDGGYSACQKRWWKCSICPCHLGVSYIMSCMCPAEHMMCCQCAAHHIDCAGLLQWTHNP